MATTKIWPVKGYLGKLVIYVENPEKTANPKTFELSNMTNKDRQGLSDVIEYAVNGDKTVSEHFVTGINCSRETARNEMLLTKRRYEKEGGRIAFHGYQSFAPGEGTPEIVHEIGVKLAQELWGGRFEVLVATHLDTANHLHNHFLLNSVSFADGRRFACYGKDYRRMRDTSDRLCREYGLSVIEKPTPGKTKQYAEWSADKNGKPTWRGIIKADVNEAIKSSMTDTQFFVALKAKGYEIKMGKDISVRPPDKERFFRLARNFGDDYTLESIRRRILYQRSPVRNRSPNKRHRQYDRILQKSKRKKVGGLRGLYLHYRYLLGNIPKQQSAPQRSRFAIKQDRLRLDKISAQTRLLVRNRIETDIQLFSYRDSLASEMSRLTDYRANLRKKMRLAENTGNNNPIKAEVTKITARLKDLRRDVSNCDEIAERSGVIRQTISAITNDEKDRKEMGRNVQLRRSR
jgi:hypothetical protein